ncbi:hypothetical protein FHS89_001778 [Rubricella aquisinus]|uniref:Phage tail assembly chaperone protein, E, or 41 or 14 n=1 Tax=Rubricella aquisinus TaxID=2028108 RepID=A0A840WKY8_9RHOB|nr:phage tail assembly protein [Rubricella aquisinus]MBB5515758.1 hypothetical protein [Rubricella aquisinus]
MDLPITISLKRPITVDGKTIDSLTFDEPTIGAQIDYAELEDELGLAEMRHALANAGASDTGPDGIPASVSMRVTQFWIEALAGLPKGAARGIKASDQMAVNTAVDAVLSVQAAGSDEAPEVGNESPAL